MKYIDAEKLIAEIERQIDCSSKRIHPGKNDGTSTHYRGEVTALFTIKSVVTSLQQVQPEVDLKEEAYMRGFAQGAKEEREAFTPLINRLCEAILFEWEDAADLARKTLIQIKEN